MKKKKRINHSNDKTGRDYKITYIPIPDGSYMYYVYHFKIGFGATFNSINDDEDNYDWEYAKYLPHVFSDDKQKRYFASSYDEMKSISADLENIFKERQEIKKAGEEKEKDVVEDSATYKAFEPYYVLITNDIFLSKSLSIFEKVMNANENY